ncbi:phospholipase D family protein [Formicincola oecophyllae]|uniref:Phospholipase D n=1 Tax=Formicincola oecophyllae TaxID=2558361 RepID=A0A4Y6U7M9_9PROT|nr:phospholipase D family protein [Formicincola oecophyllae]QDH13164.2 phospholipase D family protein [Formicincola oecophyllae]
MGFSHGLPCAIAQPCPLSPVKVRWGFSPEGSARQLLLATLGQARHSIKMMAYSFRAPDIANALVAARQRGVNVQVAMDYGAVRRDGRQRHMVCFLQRHGVKVRIDHSPGWEKQHDKLTLTDDNTVVTGSMNFTPSSEKHKSENIVAIQGNAALMNAMEAHFQNRWALSQPYGQLFPHQPCQGGD